MSDTESFEAVAARIASLVGEASGRNVNIMGEGGRIVASNDPSRVGQLHDGARRIMAGEIDELAIGAAEAAAMSGVKVGYNGAVMRGGRRVACIGISGDPAEVRPLQRLAAIVLREELDRLDLESKKDASLTRARGQIEEIADRMLVLSLNGSVIAARSGAAGRSFKVVVEEMRSLAGRIGEELRSLG